MAESAENYFRVTLLGTGAPPPYWTGLGEHAGRNRRSQIIFDAGRGAVHDS